MKKNTKQIIILILVLFSMVFVLSACNKNIKIDLSDYITVTYDCLGGHIDKLPTRTLYAKPNTLIVEPKGTQGLVQPKKSGYTLEGWYTKYTADDYVVADDGEYVYDYIYTLDENGKADYVGYPYYYSDAEGLYVGEILNEGSDMVYSLYDAENESHKNLPRFNMVIRYTLYNAENAEHKNLSHYTRKAAYIYYDENNPDYAGLLRYNASLSFKPEDKWNFATNRIGEEPITLYANWVKNMKINWNYNNGTGSSMSFENGINGTVINRGEVIRETSIIPDKTDYTFTYWYKDAECTEIWDFSTDVFPTNESEIELNLYAGYVEGIYTRITKSSDLSKIKNNPNGKYLLCADVNFSEYAEIGTVVFKGELNGNGHTISGIDVNAVNSSKKPIDLPKYYGLFSEINGATIKNLKITGKINIDPTSNKTLYLGSVAGKDNGNSKIENCEINLNLISEQACSSDIYAGAYVGEKNNTYITNCVFNSNYADGILTTGSKTLID